MGKLFVSRWLYLVVPAHRSSLNPLPRYHHHHSIQCHLPLCLNSSLPVKPSSNDSSNWVAQKDSRDREIGPNDVVWAIGAVFFYFFIFLITNQVIDHSPVYYSRVTAQCPHPSLAPNTSRRGFFSLSHHHTSPHPSLAPNARRRGIFFRFGTHNVWRSFIPLPCSKRETGLLPPLALGSNYMRQEQWWFSRHLVGLFIRSSTSTITNHCFILTIGGNYVNYSRKMGWVAVTKRTGFNRRIVKLIVLCNISNFNYWLFSQ
jgi:hypothetical protein